MAREAALLSTNAITYFEHPLAVDRYLIGRAMLQTFPGKEIFTVNWKKELRRKARRKPLTDFEHPFELLPKAEKLVRLHSRARQGGMLR